MISLIGTTVPLRLWRYGVMRCASIVMLILLLQPLLCVLHCSLVRYVTHRQTQDPADDPWQLFVCAGPAQPTPHQSILIPAFWPGVLPALTMLIAYLPLLRYLTLPIPAHPSPRTLSPLTPPPRIYAPA